MHGRMRDAKPFLIALAAQKKALFWVDDLLNAKDIEGRAKIDVHGQSARGSRPRHQGPQARDRWRRRGRRQGARRSPVHRVRTVVDRPRDQRAASVSGSCSTRAAGSRCGEASAVPRRERAADYWRCPLDEGHAGDDLGRARRIVSVICPSNTLMLSNFGGIPRPKPKPIPTFAKHSGPHVVARERTLVGHQRRRHHQLTLVARGRWHDLEDAAVEEARERRIVGAVLRPAGRDRDAYFDDSTCPRTVRLRALACSRRIRWRR